MGDLIGAICGYVAGKDVRTTGNVGLPVYKGKLNVKKEEKKSGVKTEKQKQMDAYLAKMYGGGDEEGEKPKKKKRKVKKGDAGSSLKIIDQDEGLDSLSLAKAKGAHRLSDEEMSDEEAMVVAESELDKLQEQEKDKTQVTVGDGSSWVTVDENTGNVITGQKGRGDTKSARSDDLSPPRRRPNAASKDLSPRRRRHDSDSDQSPPRRGNNARDSSPPRRRHDSDSDQSPPRRRQDQKDSSPPRRRVDNPPPRKRHDSDSDQSPPRKRPMKADSSPPRRRHDSDSDQSPPRKRPANADSSAPRERHDSDSDQSPPRQKGPKTVNGLKAGFVSGSELTETMKAKSRAETERFNKLDDSTTGRVAETVYRDKSGKRVEDGGKAKDKGGEDENEYKNMVWGKGLVQMEEKAKMQKQIEKERFKPFARTVDDADMNDELKSVQRWGDPMAGKLKKAQPNRPKYRGPYPPNRFGIPPGYRWDGVDRSTGYERNYFQSQNNKRIQESMAVAWSVEGM